MREEAGQGPKVLLTSYAVVQLQVSSTQKDPKQISPLMTEKCTARYKRQSGSRIVDGACQKQQRRAANEPSANANMCGDHAEPDFTAKDVVQLTLDNA